MSGPVKSRDAIKTFKANGLQVEVVGQSAAGFNATVRDVGTSGKQKAFVGFILHNNDASARWLQVFYKPASEVSLGTDAPDFTVLVGASGSVAWDWLDPICEGTGLSVACTTTETGSTGPTAAMTGVIRYSE